MKTAIIDLNCKDKYYQFNMSQVSNQDWEHFTLNVIIAKVGHIGGYEITGKKITIRDNKAKIMLCWKDVNYHEFQFHLDEFGRSLNNYKDIVSSLWQDVMISYFGDKYRSALESKLETIDKSI
ncbi:MAG: hypothetical protein J6Q13_03075 [Clostridia bacterium]|nr:hypothetical protein [Clostridia bacterium]